jgi:bifunctional DNase/RNase
MLRQMVVSGLTIDPFTNSPIMILKDVDSDKAVPIWIGLLEATAIASELENIKFSRPMTHDLLRNIMESMEIKVIRVEVCDLRDNTYFALIHLIREGKDIASTPAPATPSPWPCGPNVRFSWRKGSSRRPAGWTSRPRRPSPPRTPKNGPKSWKAWTRTISASIRCNL